MGQSGELKPSCGGQKHGRFVAEARANVPLCREHYRLTVGLKFFPASRPGQFVQVACRDPKVEYDPQREHEWRPGERMDLDGPELKSRLAMLRRPFSLAGRRDTADGVELEIVYRVVGVGTDWMSRLRAGDAVHVIGPQGNAFEPPRGDGVAILVGGGVGIPPMLYLASTLAGRRAVAFSGALTRDLLPLTVTADAPAPAAAEADPLYNIAEFSRHGIPAVISTDDGSYGFHGLVTQALERYLDRYFAGEEVGGAHPTGGVCIYVCGPEGMMKRVAEIAIRRNIECQVSVERAMACGMGTCQSCVIKVRKADPSQPPMAGKEWCYRLACTDGPVFKASELLW